MWLKRKQNKNRFFGGDIPPGCDYCAHNNGKGTQVVCSQKLELLDGKCKKYKYNPLMREPRRQLTLKTEGLRKEDFIL